MLKVKKINMVAMVTKIAIYLHFTRKKQHKGIEKIAIARKYCIVVSRLKPGDRFQPMIIGYF
jgi:hypothetical protein